MLEGPDPLGPQNGDINLKNYTDVDLPKKIDITTGEASEKIS